MGWSSGTRLFSKIIEATMAIVDDEKIRYELYTEYVEAFTDYDWDNLDECVGIDPAYDKVFKEYYDIDDEEWDDMYGEDDE
jgi:hypothetical protein